MMADKNPSLRDVLRTFREIRKRQAGEQSVLRHLTQNENCGLFDGLKIATRKLLDEAGKGK